MGELHLSTTIVAAGPAAAIVLTDDQVAELGSSKNPPVTVTIRGITVRVRVARMGGRNLIGFRKELRTELGISAGDVVEAVVALDTADRTVEVPAELAAAMSPHQRAAYDAWSFTRRKEAARSVAEAKTPQTRERRIAKVLAELP